MTPATHRDHPGLRGYRHRARRRAIGLALGLAALLAMVAVDIATGPALLRPAQVWAGLTGLTDDRMSALIVRTIRLPVAAMAALVGMALGVSGTVMQTVLDNRLASSYTLGISAGAGFGAALVIVLGGAIPLSPDYAVPAAAFGFASLACAAVFAIGSRKGATASMMILAGIALLFLFQALTALLQYLASPDALQQVVFWLFGSLLKSSWPSVAIVAAALALVLPVMVGHAWQLTALQLGDARASALGVRPRRLRLLSLACVSLLTGAAVAFVGTIGFVGLVAPHMARMLIGNDHRFLLPGSALAGALLLSASSIVSKVIYPGAVIPIGIVTAVLGVPFFLALALGRKGDA